MKALLAVSLCFVAAACGSGKTSGPTPSSSYTNGATLATATSYWSGSCAVTLLHGQIVPQTVDLTFTNDGAAESTVAGSKCQGTYSLEQQGGMNVAMTITTSCTNNYVAGLLNPIGSTSSGSFQVTSGDVFEGSDLGFAGANGQPCDFALIQGQEP